MALPTNVLAEIESLREEGLPFGFSPWRDNEGQLWGHLVSITATTMTVDQVDTLGQKDERSEYRFSEIALFTFDRTYAQRLSLLSTFTPTLPVKRVASRSAKDRARILRRAFETGEVIDILIRGDSSPTSVVVLWNSEPWLRLTSQDDLGHPQGQFVIRTSVIAKIWEPNAYTEASTWLLRQHLP